MKTRVDPDRCQGHTLCQYSAPEIYKIDDVSGHAYVANEDVPSELEEYARMAAANCPEQAIIVEE